MIEWKIIKENGDGEVVIVYWPESSTLLLPSLKLDVCELILDVLICRWHNFLAQSRTQVRVAVLQHSLNLEQSSCSRNYLS